MHWSDGSLYKGEWKNGKMDGFGQMSKENKIIEGIWSKNTYIGNENDQKKQMEKRLPKKFKNLYIHLNNFEIIPEESQGSEVIDKQDN